MDKFTGPHFTIKAPDNYPEFIPGSWFRLAGWLICSRVIMSYDYLESSVSSLGKARPCPRCGSEDTIITTTRHPTIPYHYYCRYCWLVWRNYIASCPDCGCFLENLRCPNCEYDWDEELVKELHEAGDITIWMSGTDDDYVWREGVPVRRGA